MGSRGRAERRQVDSAPQHAAARERRLLRRIHEHADPSARDLLAEEMLPPARALAGRYANRGASRTPKEVRQPGKMPGRSSTDYRTGGLTCQREAGAVHLFSESTDGR